MTFLLKRVTATKRFKIELYVHDSCGLQFYKIYDNIPTDNYTFSLHVKTPPDNSKGIQHIIEHSVFCGSANYNVKEPFKNLLQSSFQTFLNAATYADHTEYPVASTNYHDFWNMVSVYFDAIFNPNLLYNKAIFLQEGVNHQKDGDVIVHNGVVLNEMYANYSDIIYKCFAAMQGMLLSGTYLENDSGGNPEQIIELKFEEVVQYYKKFYNPSNMCIVIHGKTYVDDDIDQLRKILARYSLLDTKVDVQPICSFQPYLSKRIVGTQPDIFFCFGGIFGVPTDFQPHEITILQLLQYVLFNSDSAIITNYLQERGVCDSVVCEFYLNAAAFYCHFVLQNVDSKFDCDSVSALLLTCFRYLADLEKGPLSKEITAPRILSTLYVLEFESKEQSENYAVEICNDLATGAFYCGDALFYLQSDENNQKLRDMLANDYLIPMLKQFIVRYFIEQRLSLLCVAPASDCPPPFKAPTIKIEEAECASEQQLLAYYHAQSDTSESLAALPLLRLNQVDTDKLKWRFTQPFYNVDKDIIAIDNDDQEIVRLDLLIDISSLINEKTHKYFSLMYELLFNLTTTNYKSHERLYTQIDSIFGGYDVAVEFSDISGSECCSVYFSVQTKFQRRFAHDAISFMAHVLDDFEYSLQHDQKRVEQLLSETYANYQLYYYSDEVGQLAVHASLPGLLSSRLVGYMEGADYLAFLRRYAQKRTLVKQLTTELAACCKAMCECPRKCIVSASYRIITETGLFEEVRKYLKTSAEPVPALLYQFAPRAPLLIRAPVSTNYVSASYRIKQRTGAFLLFAHYLETQLCWDAIRVKNGAYGCSVDVGSDYMTISSYRDPNIAFTTQFFASLREHVRSAKMDQNTLDYLKIGCLAHSYLPQTVFGIYTRIRDYFYHRVRLSDKLRWIDEIRECNVESFFRQADMIEYPPTIAVVKGDISAQFGE